MKRTTSTSDCSTPVSTLNSPHGSNNFAPGVLWRVEGLTWKKISRCEQWIYFVLEYKLWCDGAADRVYCTSTRLQICRMHREPKGGSEKEKYILGWGEEEKQQWWDWVVIDEGIYGDDVHPLN